MPKYLFEASYTTEGAKGVQSAGGSSRRDAVARVAESAGGTLECFYFAFGVDDVILIADVPDNKTALAMAATVGSSSAISSYETVPLLTTQEVDAAMKIAVGYRAPGT